MATFANMVKMSDTFDRGLVLYLRVSLGMFLEQNDSLQIEGLPI